MNRQKYEIDVTKLAKAVSKRNAKEFVEAVFSRLSLNRQIHPEYTREQSETAIKAVLAGIANKYELEILGLNFFGE